MITPTICDIRLAANDNSLKGAKSSRRYGFRIKLNKLFDDATTGNVQQCLAIWFRGFVVSVRSMKAKHTTTIHFRDLSL